jgi:hypothetical protein
MGNMFTLGWMLGLCIFAMIFLAKVIDQLIITLDVLKL